MEAADAHCKAGADVWEWAGTDDGPRGRDVVLACAGDVLTMATVAAAQTLRERVPHLSVRVVNVVDLMNAGPSGGPSPREGRHVLL
jgi:xylulose-5-phosphate/fructose-6-phosphate phosphoketolase